MLNRRTIAAGCAVAVLLLGGAGAVTAAATVNGPVPESPVVTDTPEPGDTPDAVLPPVAPTP